MVDCIRFPRTKHILGSRKQHGDDLEDVPFDEIKGKYLVVEEKMDGANCGVSFSEDGDLLLQSRGHFLRGGPREKQFDLFKSWANMNVNMLFDVLGGRYIMYGEWLFAKHTFFYDALPHHFMEFDIFDKETKEFLSEPRRNALLEGAGITQVRVLHRGPVNSFAELGAMVGPSAFITSQRIEKLRQQALHVVGENNVERVLSETDLSPEMEGLYIKQEEDGKVVGRYKLVRQTFTNAILDSETHWHDRPIIPNMLAK